MAPAGDYERLVAAIKAGADEVYMGVAGFGARRFAKNFSVEEYVDAIDFAHRSNVAVHLTFNTILSDAELDLVYSDVKRLYESGLDEVIVQDFGVASWLRGNFPDLPLCASTQLSPGSVAELNWFEKQGFARAVLARELSLEQMKAIREKTKIELEVFASGALCLGCSGKCYLSSFIGGRSGNRGMCAQPCRQYYKAEKLGANQNDDSNESTGAEYGYFLSLKDQLQGRREIETLLKIGIDSIKIEGRMKSPNYVYEVVRYYRDLVDALSDVSSDVAEKRLSVKKSSDEKVVKGDTEVKSILDPKTEEARRRDVASVFNRGYDFGYYYESDPNIINEHFSSNFGVEVGRVRRDAIRLSRSLRNGDGVVFLDDTARKLGGLNVSRIRLVNPTSARAGRIVDVAEEGDLVQFDVPTPEGAVVLYRTSDYRLNKEIENALKQTRRREQVDAILTAKVGSKLELTLKNKRAEATVSSDQNVERAQKNGVDAESLLASLDRFGETSFYLRAFKPIFDSNAFVPKSLLNQLRQAAVDALEKKTLESYRRVAPAKIEEPSRGSREEPTAPNVDDPRAYFAACVRTRAQYDACKEFGVSKIYYESQPIQYENRFRFQASSEYSPLAGSLTEAIRLDAQNKPFALDWFFNVGNARAVRFLADRFANASTIYLSPEISDRAVDALFKRIGDYPTRRSLKLGLPVYGRLLAMFTQKTLFNDAKVRLTNADDRRFLVERNVDRWANPSGKIVNEVDATEQNAPSSAPISGSSIYLYEPLDLIDAIPWILRSGVGEIRFDFTTERSADVLRVLERASAPNAGKYTTFSYGYTRDGVF